MRRALTPGTFDPITFGHIDVIKRAAQLQDEVIVAVAASVRKNPLFTLDERVEMAREALKDIPNVRVEPFSGLLVDFAKEMDANVVIKGLRAITDFEYEFQMNSLNHKLSPELETVYLMSPSRYMYLSSSIVRELAMLQSNDMADFVPDCVCRALKEKFANQ